MSDLATLLDTACDLKRQLNQCMIDLYSGTTSARTTGKVLTNQYAPAINAIVAATTTEELTTRRDTLNTRLHTGWTYCALHPGNDEAYDLWEALLVEYMVTDDALNHAGVVAGTLERVRWIGQITPLEQRSFA